MDIMIEPTHKVIVNMKWYNEYKVFSQVLSS